MQTTHACTVLWLQELTCQHLSNMVCAYGLLAYEAPVFINAARQEVGAG